MTKCRQVCVLAIMASLASFSQSVFACLELPKEFSVDFMEGSRLALDSSGLSIDGDKVFFDQESSTWLVEPSTRSGLYFWSGSTWRMLEKNADESFEDFKDRVKGAIKSGQRHQLGSEVELPVMDAGGTQTLGHIEILPNEQKDLHRWGDTTLGQLRIVKAGAVNPQDKEYLYFTSSRTGNGTGYQKVTSVKGEGLASQGALEIFKPFLTRSLSLQGEESPKINLSVAGEPALYRSSGCGVAHKSDVQDEQQSLPAHGMGF